MVRPLEDETIASHIQDMEDHIRMMELELSDNMIVIKNLMTRIAIKLQITPIQFQTKRFTRIIKPKVSHVTRFDKVSQMK